MDEIKLEEAQNPEEFKCRDILAKVSADFDNYKKRVDRDRDDMIFFLKNDIFKKILPRIDDL
ncbi:nucleotide exchange factor GrpE, partial [bacterium]|nr:nucleotide exchange factor GrpE [bacterium]